MGPCCSLDKGEEAVTVLRVSIWDFDVNHLSAFLRVLGNNFVDILIEGRIIFLGTCTVANKVKYLIYETGRFFLTYLILID